MKKLSNDVLPVFYTYYSHIDLISDPITLSVFIYANRKDKKFTLQEISKILNISFSEIENSIQKLIDLNLVKNID